MAIPYYSLLNLPQVFRGRCLQSGRAVALKRLSLRPPKGWSGRGENPVRNA